MRVALAFILVVTILHVIGSTTAAPAEAAAKIGVKSDLSIKDVYEKIKNYFKDLHIDLQEKYAKFGEWAIAKYEKGLEKGKDKTANLKNLAKKFIVEAKALSKDVLAQGKDFFEHYKKNVVGSDWDDIREKFQEFEQEIRQEISRRNQ